VKRQKNVTVKGEIMHELAINNNRAIRIIDYTAEDEPNKAVIILSKLANNNSLPNTLYLHNKMFNFPGGGNCKQVNPALFIDIIKADNYKNFKIIKGYVKGLTYSHVWLEYGGRYVIDASNSLIYNDNKKSEDKMQIAIMNKKEYYKQVRRIRSNQTAKKWFIKEERKWKKDNNNSILKYMEQYDFIGKL
jgi:hypothetical protein